jgi:hypothetical protein
LILPFDEIPLTAFSSRCLINVGTQDNQFWNYENQRRSCGFGAEKTFPQSGHGSDCPEIGLSLPETRFNLLRQKLRKKIP